MNHVRFLIVDEADAIVDLGFQQELDSILEMSELPKKEERVSMIATPTVTPQTNEVAKGERISLSRECENNSKSTGIATVEYSKLPIVLLTFAPFLLFNSSLPR